MLSEAKVGLLFFIGLGMALGFTLFVSDLGASRGRYSVRFPRVEGLRTGDRVLYNGVEVGRVGQVTPVLEGGVPAVEVSFDLEPNIDGMLMVNGMTLISVEKGMLGGSQLTIRTDGPGEPVSDARLRDIRGVPPTTIGDAVNAFGHLIEDNREDIRSAVGAMPAAVEGFSDLASSLREVVQENRANIQRAITKLGDMGAAIDTLVQENRLKFAEAINNFSGMTAEFRELAKENRGALKRAIDKFPEAVDHFSGAAAEIKEMVASNRNSVDRALAAFARFGPRLEEIGDHVSKITDQIASGKGTIGRLVYEEGVYDQATAVLTAAEQRLEEVKPVTSGFADLRFYVGVGSGYNTDRQNFYNKLYLRIEPRPWKFYEGGATYRTAPADHETADEDPDELGIDIDLLLGWRFFPDEVAESYRLTVAGGMIEGKLGGRANVTLMAHRLWTELILRDRHDEWDPDERRYEDGEGLYARWLLEGRIWRRVYLSVGADDVIDDPAPWIGLRAELLDNDIRNAVAARSILP
jgi:ABC-type transporter Mla subunit MlaD